ncbi:hypothetical protein OXPF_39560 [Oxobacter pfennigii]|uniref:Uncharacterized protein n=1 Tax=Oxobacter pfennigii TaxID=36849 RepID=A0A0P8YRH4_9CLOT|nr:hypothetical protein [Oxobacter pfennigii]KPU42177.1 hypothetical protein OXPF_39560 [Oxobacter pfennigii]
MGENDYKKLWSSGSNVLYYADNSATILKALNDAIHGLYYLGGEHSYIIHTLNTTTYVEEEYKRLLSGIIENQDLSDIANKLEMVRSLLFGDCFNWDYICEELEKIPPKGEAK